MAALVGAIAPSDDTERAHRADVLTWLASTPERFDPNMGRFLAKTRGQPLA